MTGYAHRDLGTCFVLASLLEQSGFKCHITSPSRAKKFHIRYWQPHAVFWMRLNNLKQGANLYPKSFHYYCPGEGGEQYVFAEEKDLAENQFLFSTIKRSFLWGQKSFDNILQKINELKEGSHLYRSVDWANDTVHIVGHPRMDIARFVNNVDNEKNKTNIGFIGSFSVINPASKISLLSRVFKNENGHVHGTFQINLANTYARLFSSLDQSRYSMSLRPYPAESHEDYSSMPIVKNGYLKIDKNYEFANWVAQQDLIIAPTSSTVPQIVMSGKPFILVDFVDNKPEQSVYRISLSRLFHKHMPKSVPKDYDTLLRLIEKYKEIPVSSKGMNSLLEHVYNLSPRRQSEESFPSALATMANFIVKDMRTPLGRQFIHLFSFPQWLVLLVDGHVPVDTASYNDFNYEQLKKNLTLEFKEIIRNIVDFDVMPK